MHFSDALCRSPSDACDSLPADPVVRSQMISQFMRVVVATKRVDADNDKVRHE